MKRQKMNKIIMQQLLVNKEEAESSIHVASERLSEMSQSGSHDISQIVQRNRAEQDNFKLFSEMGEYILHRRNKAVFFYIAALQLLDYSSVVPQPLKNLFMRAVFLVIKYAVIKLFKVYKRLKNNQPPKITKFS